MTDVLKTQSIRSLYRGLGVATFFSVPALSFYLHTYDQCKEHLGSLISPLASGKDGRDLFGVHALSAASAEALSGVFWTPMVCTRRFDL